MDKREVERKLVMELKQRQAQKQATDKRMRTEAKIEHAKRGNDEIMAK